MSDKKEIKTVPLNPALLGKKIGMTRVYDAKGKIVPVTVIQAGPCVVTQIKCENGVDGYNAIQLGFGDMKAKHSTYPMIGHAAKAPNQLPAGPAIRSSTIRAASSPGARRGSATTSRAESCRSDRS